MPNLRARSGVPEAPCVSRLPISCILTEHDNVILGDYEQNAATLAGGAGSLGRSAPARPCGRRRILLCSSHHRRVLPTLVRGAPAEARERCVLRHLCGSRARRVSPLPALPP